MTFYARYGKRAFDLMLTIPALVLLAPFLALIGCVLRICQGAPVLFRHDRPGRDGVVFTLLKFRTMITASDERGNPLPDEARVTPVGKFLRDTSIDELPELFNVVRGDMSLVGPRPLLIQYLPRYSPFQMRRHKALPGITGWAQVHGRNAMTWARKFELDVWYVDHISFPLDLRILILTILKILTREGIQQPGFFSSEEFTGGDQQP